MSLVLDASMAIAWLFADETTDATEAIFDEVAAKGAIVPAIWGLEVANALQKAMRQRRMTLAERELALRQLGHLPIEVDPQTHLHAWGATLELADLHGMTPYDASYLELARREMKPLATLDGTLARAAKEVGIELKTP